MVESVYLEGMRTSHHAAKKGDAQRDQSLSSSCGEHCDRSQECWVVLSDS